MKRNKKFAISGLMNPYSSAVEMNSAEMDDNERYCLQRCAFYLNRHLMKFSTLSRDVLSFAFWILGEDVYRLMEPEAVAGYTSQWEEFFEEFKNDYYMDEDDLTTQIRRACRLNRSFSPQKFTKLLLKTLNQRARHLVASRPARTYKNLKSLERMFALNKIEIELCTFLFIVESYNKPESFFRRELDACEFRGRKFLSNILGTTESELHRSVTKLNGYGLLDGDMDNISLDDEIVTYLQKPGKSQLTSQFYAPARECRLPVDAHFIPQVKRDHLLKLLRKQGHHPTHVLFHGPPGTGKTSLARRLGRELQLPTYEIASHEENKARFRRAGIIACINTTQTAKGALIIVDEADNLLNTDTPWFSRGETQDKGWLNQLLEIPGVRMVWITNSIGLMNEAVMRRFSYNIAFKPLNHRQRVIMWDRVLRRNRVKRHFGRRTIESLAEAYDVSAGVADMAVRKAIDSGAQTKNDLRKSIEIGLDAYQELQHQGLPPLKEKSVAERFTLEGLNYKGDLQTTLEQLDMFGRYLERHSASPTHAMRLLFYGPPGAGKSEMARYIGQRLSRKINFKRFSDLQSKYVGQGEKNLRDAFNRAQSERGILVIDEVDSFLFSRSRSEHSWEVSFTNEFLTAMERFTGLLICTTNRIHDLDPAALRRFTHKVEFDYLSPEGNLIFFERILAPLSCRPVTPALRGRLMDIERLTPGDFKTVHDRYAFYPEPQRTPELFIKGLSEEARLKVLSGSKKPIGFKKMP